MTRLDARVTHQNDGEHDGKVLGVTNAVEVEEDKDGISGQVFGSYDGCAPMTKENEMIAMMRK